LDEHTTKEVELLILHLAQQWTDKSLHMTFKDIAKEMPDSLVAKLNSLDDTIPILRNLIQRKLMDVKGTDMYVISPNGIFYLRKYLLTISIPENRQKVDEMIKDNISESSKQQIGKLLDDVKDLPQDEKGKKVIEFIKQNPVDIALALIRVGIALSTSA